MILQPFCNFYSHCELELNVENFAWPDLQKTFISKIFAKLYGYDFKGNQLWNCLKRWLIHFFLHVFSFTIEVWLSLDSGHTTGPYPVACSTDKTICLTIENSVAVGYYGNHNVTSVTSLNADQWYNVILRYRIEGKMFQDLL